MKIIRQKKHPDCSLIATIHGGILNGFLKEKKYTQEYCEKLMEGYYGKSPDMAVAFLNALGEKLKVYPITFTQAKKMIDSGKSIVCFMNYTYDWWTNYAEDRIENATKDMKGDPNKRHYLVIKGEKNGVFLYDSNFPIPYKIDYWERFCREGVLKKFFIIGR